MLMLTGKKVRVRLAEQHSGQRLCAFLGRVLDVSETCLYFEGKGICLADRQPIPADVDKDIRPIVIPWCNICNIHILPDDFDLDNIQMCVEDTKLGVLVKGAPLSWIAEVRCDKASQT